MASKRYDQFSDPLTSLGRDTTLSDIILVANPLPGPDLGKLAQVEQGAIKLNASMLLAGTIPTLRYGANSIPIASLIFPGAGGYLDSDGNFTVPPTGLTDPTIDTGDLIYRSALGLVRLPVGTNGQIFTVVGGIPVWASTPGGLSWAIVGNDGTIDGTHFIGNTDDVPLTFRVNNVQAGRIENLLRNTALGYEAGLPATSEGSQNTAIGYQSLKSLVESSSNTAVGVFALKVLETGEQNVAVGYNSLSQLTAGDNNMAFGVNAGIGLVTGSRNTILGTATLPSSLSDNIILATGDGTIRQQFDDTGALTIAVQDASTDYVNFLPWAQDASGNIKRMGAWPSRAGGDDTQVQYNDAGALAGSAAFTWDNSNEALTVAGMYIATGTTASATKFMITHQHATTADVLITYGENANPDDGTFNSFTTWGHNFDQSTPGFGGWYFSLESNYQPFAGATDRWFEGHLERRLTNDTSTDRVFSFTGSKTVRSGNWDFRATTYNFFLSDGLSTGANADELVAAFNPTGINLYHEDGGGLDIINRDETTYVRILTEAGGFGYVNTDAPNGFSTNSLWYFDQGITTNGDFGTSVQFGSMAIKTAGNLVNIYAPFNADTYSARLFFGAGYGAIALNDGIWNGGDSTYEGASIGLDARGLTAPIRFFTHTTGASSGTAAGGIWNNQKWTIGGAASAALVTLELIGTDALLLPAGNTAARPSGVNGYIRYNSQTNKFEGYENGAWANIIGAGGITGVTTFGSTPNANGLSVSGSNILMQPADATNPGGISTGAQDIAGAKTFKAQATFQGTGIGILSASGTSGIVAAGTNFGGEFSSAGVPVLGSASATTAGVVLGLLLQRTGSYTAAANDGIELRFASKNSAAAGKDIAAIHAVITNVTAGAEDGAFKWQLMAGGAAAATKMSLSSGGVLEMTSIKTAAPSGGTAKEWKVGDYVTAAITVDLAHYVEVEVNGTLRKFVTAT